MASGGAPPQPTGSASVVTGALEPAGHAHYVASNRAVPALCIIGDTQLHCDIEQRLQTCKRVHDLAFNLKRIDSEAQLHTKKEERAPGFTYESLLKADWCRKHQEDVFGCIMVLVNIDLSNTREAFEASAEAAVDKVKAKLKGRQTNLLVVVTTAAERLPFYEKPDSCQSAVRKKCELESTKNVTLLHATRGLEEGVRRVSQYAEERAQAYYKDEAKRVKKVKDNAPKAIQPRHAFKIGYFSEIRGQFSTALRYYTQCYEGIRTHAVDTFASRDIKACSEVVMFRICLLRLLFEEAPKPAQVVPAVARQFREHLLWYRSCSNSAGRGHGAARLGGRDSASQGRSVSRWSQDKASETPSAPQRYPQSGSSVVSGGDESKHSGSFGLGLIGAAGQPGWDLLSTSETQALAQASPVAVIAHHAAVARQCERFGWMLQRTQQRWGDDATAPAAGGGDGDYAAPAYHFHCAALALQLRRRCVQHCRREQDATAYTAADVAAERDPQFLGQAKGGGAAGDAKKELMLLLTHEEGVPHLEEVVQLCCLSRAAYGQSRPRMAMVLGFLIARARAEMEQFVEAKEELLEVVPYFVQHPWPGITDAMLRLLMMLSLETAALEDYLKAALEYMAGEGADRVGVFAAISKWARGEEVPEGEGDPLHRIFPNVSEKPVLSVHASNHPFFSIMCQFHRPLVCVHEKAVLRVRLATKAVFGIPITSLAVQFSNASVDFEKAVDATTLRRERPVVLEHGVVLTEPGVVKVKSITVGLGSLRVCYRVKESQELQTLLSRLLNAPAAAAGPPGAVSGAVYPHTLETAFPHLGYHLDTPPLFKDRPAVRILKPSPAVSLSLDHKLPVLLNESYAVKLVIDAGPEAVLGGSVIVPGIPNVSVISACAADGSPINTTTIEDDADSTLFGGEASGAGGALRTTELMLPAGIAEGDSRSITMYLQFALAGEHAFNVLLQYSTDRCKDMQKTLSCDFKVIVPFDLEVCVSDTQTWVADGVDSAIQDPFRRVVYRHSTSVPHQNHKRLLNTGAARLGVVTQSSFMPYGVTTTKISQSDVTLRLAQPATLCVNAICTVDAFDVEITDIHVCPRAGMKILDVPGTEAAELSAEEEVCYTWVVEPTDAAGMHGEVEVHVRRVGSTDPPIPYALDLPLVRIHEVPVVARVEMPSHGRVGEAMLLTLHLENTSTTVTRSLMVMADGKSSPQGFLWAGRTQATLTLLPAATSKLQFQLVPLTPGHLSLPALAVHVDKFPQPIMSMNERTSVFVDTCNTSLKKAPAPVPQE